jgi:hypothetical protein
VILLVAQAIDSQLFGLSPRAPCALARADGGWSLSFPDGSQLRGDLQPASRVLPSVALLVLRTGHGTHWLLLRAGPTNGTELRRLRVSMRLSS